jgi:hypothetical protein
MTIADEPLRPQGFRRTLYNLIHSRITSQVGMWYVESSDGVLSFSFLSRF